MDSASMTSQGPALSSRCTVIIPAYRPDERLWRLATEVLERGYRLIVVDDGGGADYLPIFEGLDPRTIILRHPENRGKGAAIKTGLAHLQTLTEGFNPAEPPLVGIMDADGQHLTSDMARVFEGAAANPDKLTLGVRVVGKEMPFRSRFGNGITRAVFRMLTGAKVSDTQTGLRAFSVALIPEMLGVEGDRYEYEMAVLTRMAHRRIGFHEVSIATLYEDRQNSTSHFRVVRDSVRIYATLLKFAGSSFISFLVDYGLFNLFVFLASLIALPWADTYDILAANIAARVFSGCVNYYLNCRYVFGRKPSWKSAGEYLLLALLVLAVNSGV
ncbi:MAG: bifunctional glycosyltransferase family 2/GtrA family protein, partial [Clostridia bacterium]|nr:bifunctional glycosyltransferase family 2/GtrA family protein [Clostridia bacterium]